MFGIGTEYDTSFRPVVRIRPDANKPPSIEIYDLDAFQRSTKIQSVDLNGTSGGVSAVQIKPNKKGSSTGDLTGLEVSPRANDAPCGALICIKADPVLKTATAARTVGAIRGLEINIDLPLSGSAYTITNDVSAIRIFPNFGAGHTFSGKRAVMQLAGVNTSQWEYFLDIISNNGDLLVANTDTPEFGIPIRHHGTNYWIMCSAATS